MSYINIQYRITRFEKCIIPTYRNNFFIVLNFEKKTISIRNNNNKNNLCTCIKIDLFYIFLFFIKLYVCNIIMNKYADGKFSNVKYSKSTSE